MMHNISETHSVDSLIHVYAYIYMHTNIRRINYSRAVIKKREKKTNKAKSPDLHKGAPFTLV